MERSFFALALVLVGCGGPAFSARADETDGGGKAAGLDDAGAGGAVGVSAGGSGGSVEDRDSGTGGRVAAGGAGGSRIVGDAAGGAAPDDGGHVACAQFVTHSDGLGQTWQDCVPLGTYDEAEAMAACKASNAKICVVVVACGPSLPEVRGYNTVAVPVNPTSPEIGGRWGYAGALAGYVGTGTSGELCSGSIDPNNRKWR